MAELRTPDPGAPRGVGPAGPAPGGTVGERECPPAVARAIAVTDPGYPCGLRDLEDAPVTVYVCGCLPAAPRAVAIVGSRAASPYGLEVARRLAADLARLGCPVVSGLARGIDAAAHRGALDAGGSTVAVLPGGLDAVTPRHHRELAAEIARRGALLSEVARGEPNRGMFVRRNRLIAALAAATVVVEAAERSGALSTAAAALRLRRPLLAVPGDVDRPTSRGCHALLRRGARLCEGAGDVLETLGGAAPGDAPEARLAAVLAPQPLPAETLARAAGVPLADSLAALLRLEWAGAAVAHGGQRWARRTGRGA